MNGGLAFFDSIRDTTYHRFVHQRGKALGQSAGHFVVQADLLDERGDELGIGPDDLIAYGPHKAKVSLDFARRVESEPTSKLVLVKDDDFHWLAELKDRAVELAAGLHGLLTKEIGRAHDFFFPAF